MARKPVPAKAAPKAAARKPVASTAVRNTAIPKVAAKAVPVVSPAKPVITHDAIAVRAFEISCGPNGGSEFDNWLRAEHELRGV